MAGWILACAAGGLLIAQALGYKLYGRSTVVENRPLLKDALIVSRLEPPNIAITQDGSRIPVPGVVFRKEVFHMQQEAFSRLFNELDPIRIKLDASMPSGIAAERRKSYWNALIFEPKFLPERLPKYGVADFGEFIRDSGLHAEQEDQANP